MTEQFDREKPLVVVIHGIWMHGVLMTYLCHRLRKAGYQTVQFNYRFLHDTATTSAVKLARLIDTYSVREISIVAHSLGGLVALEYLRDFSASPVSTLVMLGTPLKGSQTARVLARSWIGKKLLGKSLDALTSVARSVENVSIGMVAGTVGLGVGQFITRLPRPFDGAVSLDETRVDWLKDHVAIKQNHFGMMFSPSAAAQVIHFLRFKSFVHDEGINETRLD